MPLLVKQHLVYREKVSFDDQDDDDDVVADVDDHDLCLKKTPSTPTI